MRTQEGQRWIVPLGGAAAELAQVGGKGAALMALAEDQFPVPPGFVIATAAYRRYVADNDLQPIIDGQLAALPAHEPAALARAADVIQAVFQRGTMSPEIASAIDAAYATLDDPEPAVAVRSSATAEDLPELSFAGQQETFLNVRGSDAVRAAVIGCWASLWTARAIGYRQQMAVPAAGVAMAVVVQEMVPAEVSGVLFTANPVTGQRGEMVIEAAPGLGEGLVGGTVTPESYAVARDSAVPIRVTSAPVDAGSTDGAGFRKSRLLPDAMLQELGQLGRRVKAHAGGSPRDIEWAIADGKLWLLQARPITNLPDAPLSEEVWESPIPGATWVRRQVVEHMPEPLSPLFAELYLREGLNRSINVIVSAMGMEDLMEQILSGPFFATVHGFGYSRGNIDLPRKAIPGMARAFFAGPFWMFHHGIAYWRNEGPPPYLATIARWHDVDPAAASDEELLRGMRELAIADAVYWFAAAIAIGAAKVSDWVLDGFLSVIAPNSGLHSGSFLRGFPSRTLEAEAELDAMARHARESAELREYILSTPADQLLAGLPGSPAGARLREELDRYFARHGHQIYNLDFVEPTLVEAPLPVFLGLKALVREPGQDALARQADVARARNRLTDETARSFDPLRRWLFRHLVRWAQQYAPYREDALFFVGAGWPLLRRFALELGRRLEAIGTLNEVDDVFFLESGELAEAAGARDAGHARVDLACLAQDRRDLREQRKRLHPPAAVPPTAGLRMGSLDLSGRETQRRNAADATLLRGFAVSPGRVTAPASVILSPADFGQMEPGSILVCPTTTPAWTPLFAQARGLVTDIGGILAHGSIVAREYGIPAVMGTGSATQRIASGQQITVDGTSGTVSLAAD